MSGRLIITTKKSYCPWSSSNVEKVLHDERLERERSDRTREEEAAAASEWRIDELKRRRGIAGGVVRPIDEHGTKGYSVGGGGGRIPSDST